MKGKFKGYIPYTDSEFDDLWSNASIIIDANVLLNLYRYTKNTQEEMLKTLIQYKERLWLPHQAAQEFMRNRKSTISDQMAIYDTLKSRLCKTDSRKKVLNDISRHLHIDIDELKKIVDECEIDRSEKIKNYLDKVKEKEDDYYKTDSTFNTILELFESKTGEPFDSTEYLEVCKEAKQRYKYNIPPGYEDLKDKSDDPNSPSNAYGDFVFWRQVVEYARNNTNVNSVIIITDDSKDDWWQKRNNKTIGPWPEMIQEFNDETGKMVWIYKSDSFLKIATSKYQVEGEPKTEEERESISNAINEISKYVDTAEKISLLEDIIAIKEYRNKSVIEPISISHLSASEIRLSDNYIVEVVSNWFPSYSVENILNEVKRNDRIKVISFGEENDIFEPKMWMHIKSKYSKKQLSLLLDEYIEKYLPDCDYNLVIKYSSEVDSIYF